MAKTIAGIAIEMQQATENLRKALARIPLRISNANFNILNDSHKAHAIFESIKVMAKDKQQAEYLCNKAIKLSNQNPVKPLDILQAYRQAILKGRVDNEEYLRFMSHPLGREFYEILAESGIRRESK